MYMVDIYEMSLVHIFTSNMTYIYDIYEMNFHFINMTYLYIVNIYEMSLVHAFTS